MKYILYVISASLLLVCMIASMAACEEKEPPSYRTCKGWINYEDDMVARSDSYMRDHGVPANGEFMVEQIKTTAKGEKIAYIRGLIDAYATANNDEVVHLKKIIDNVNDGNSLTTINRIFTELIEIHRLPYRVGEYMLEIDDLSSSVRWFSHSLVARSRIILTSSISFGTTTPP